MAAFRNLKNLKDLVTPSKLKRLGNQKLQASTCAVEKKGDGIDLVTRNRIEEIVREERVTRSMIKFLNLTLTLAGNEVKKSTYSKIFLTRKRGEDKDTTKEKKNLQKRRKNRSYKREKEK